MLAALAALGGDAWFCLRWRRECRTWFGWRMWGGDARVGSERERGVELSWGGRREGGDGRENGKGGNTRGIERGCDDAAMPADSVGSVVGSDAWRVISVQSQTGCPSTHSRTSGINTSENNNTKKLPHTLPRVRCCTTLCLRQHDVLAAQCHVRALMRSRVSAWGRRQVLGWSALGVASSLSPRKKVTSPRKDPRPPAARSTGI
eukprot:3928679-Rhodomonas_salina.3